jgi:hypothetical protein
MYFEALPYPMRPLSCAGLPDRAQIGLYLDFGKSADKWPAQPGRSTALHKPASAAIFAAKNKAWRSKKKLGAAKNKARRKAGLPEVKFEWTTLLKSLMNE